MERPDLARRLIAAFAAEDERVRERLAADGSLFDGYHPEMEAVHRANAARRREMEEWARRMGWHEA
jgi:hypothetical protein